MSMILLENIREIYEAGTLVVSAAFILGICFGALVERTGFCFRSAILQAIHVKNGTLPIQTTQVIAAVISAMLFTHVLVFYQAIDLSQSIYLSSPVRVFALVVGGFVFGIGMILTRGCISRVLVLAGTGNIRSWFSIIIAAITAYATLRGILAYPRLQLEALHSVENIPKSLPELFSLPTFIVLIAISLLLLLLLFFYARKTNLSAVLIGVIFGALITTGWWITGVLGYDEFEPAQLSSLSFTLPIGETLQYLMIFTGDKLRFTIALVGGVLAGAFLSALLSGRFRVQGFQTEMAPLRYGLGAMLMGFGGITAMGCTIGQGLTGISTLSISSLIALCSIIAGAALASRFISDEITQSNVVHADQKTA